MGSRNFTPLFGPTSRVTFHGNPWPSGHRVKELKVTPFLGEDGDVWCDLVLVGENYDAEGPGRERGDSEWESPSVWTNYGSVYFETGSPGHPFKLCSASDYPAALNGLELKLDFGIDLKTANYDEDFTFNCTILGCDTIAENTLKFSEAGPLSYNIAWSGKVAMTYVGNMELKYSFDVDLQEVVFPPVPNSAR